MNGFALPKLPIKMLGIMVDIGGFKGFKVQSSNGTSQGFAYFMMRPRKTGSVSFIFMAKTAANVSKLNSKNIKPPLASLNTLKKRDDGSIIDRL